MLLSTSVERSIAAWRLSSREVIIGAVLGATLLTYKLYKHYYHQEKELPISTTANTLRLGILNIEPFKTLIRYFSKNKSQLPLLSNSSESKNYLNQFELVSSPSSSVQSPVKAESSISLESTSEDQRLPAVNNPTIVGLSLQHTSEDQKPPAVNKPTIVGLGNCGNSCYFNAMVQCLIALEPLKQFMRDNEPVYLTDESLGKHYIDFTKCYQEFARKNQSIPAETIKETSLYDFFVNKQNLGSGQQDVQEVLNLFIGGLEPNAHEQHKEKVKQKIQGLFQQQLQSVITCNQCKSESTNGSVYNMLLLNLVSDKPHTIEECLKMFFEAETLNEYSCSTCNSKQDATKQCKIKDIQNAPEVLVIVLLRFKFEQGASKKIDTPVRFPINELRPYPDNPAGPAYELASFISHSGEIKSGHYIAHVKSSDKWYRCNDSSVEEISLDTMQQFEQSGTDTINRVFTPYVLFYTKKK